ncbi:MAG: hypothetical protein CME64_15505 [Halobacteriovoraceae bacterium]|nr:hypothetical protein [Halobacteriovoraceae bacterium]
MKKAKSYRVRLIFAALYFATFSFLFYDFPEKVEKAQNLNKLTKIHYYSLKELNSYLDFNTCNPRFNDGGKLAKVGKAHTDIGAKTKLDIDPYIERSGVVLSKLTFSSSFQKFDDEILTNGYLLTYRNSNKCFGILY